MLEREAFVNKQNQVTSERVVTVLALSSCAPYNRRGQCPDCGCVFVFYTNVACDKRFLTSRSTVPTDRIQEATP